MESASRHLLPASAAGLGWRLPLRGLRAPTASSSLAGSLTGSVTGSLVVALACVWGASAAQASGAPRPASTASTTTELVDHADPLGQWLQDRGMLSHEGSAAPGAARGAELDAAPALSSDIPPSGSPSALPASQLVVHAMGFLGVPYRWGGGSFEGGFDCSGFVQALYRQGWNVQLPRRAVEQAHATQTIPHEELQPGDLVFFNTLGARYSHVGLYIGEGRFIHSPRAGASIRMESMTARYWQTRFNGARRVNPDLLARAD